ncbi:hypothetical protein ACIQUL_27455 [Streptomyces sp. NPDC090303]|uniref:hypothetical protein n=1 Tax=Streptomyces sp. NPDC090303 TaxID=3365960 RepID=UPI003813C40E
MAKEASPEGTGGRGTIYEYRVAALDMAAMLCAAEVPGLEPGIVPDRVRLQAGSEAPLDDVVVSRGQGPDELMVERQVKLTVNPVPSDKAWQDVIDKCLQSLDEFGADVDADRRRFGVTASRPEQKLRFLRNLAGAASASDSVTAFLAQLPRRGTDYHDEWEATVRTVTARMAEHNGIAPTDAVAQETAFRIVRRLVVEIELHLPITPRYTALVGLLDERLNPSGSGQSSAGIFAKIEDLAELWGPQAASVTREMLRNSLSAQGVLLRGDPPARAHLEAAEAWTEGFLRRQMAKDRLGEGFHLDRAARRKEIATAVITHQRVVVTGPPGVGKSALTRAVAAQLRQTDQVTVVGLSLTDQTWTTIGDIERDLGPQVHLKTALAGAPTGLRVLVVDGAEQTLSDAGSLLKNLLLLLPRDEDGAALWHVVAVAREQAADTVRQCLEDAEEHADAVEQIVIDELTRAEVLDVLRAFPALVPLARLPRPARLLRNLYTVDLLVRLVLAGADPGTILGEEDVAEFVYEHLVRLGNGGHRGAGEPDDRSSVYLELAEALVVGTARHVRLRPGLGNATRGLVSDGVLVRDQSRHGFAHDVMQDYGVALWACDDPAPDLSAAPRPRRLLRAIRIAAQMRLARAARESASAVVEAWTWVTETVHALADNNDHRWEDLPFEAVFKLGRPEPVLEALADELLADEGHALVAAAVRRLRTAEEARPVLTFLTHRAHDVGATAASGALQLLGDWLSQDDSVDEDFLSAVPTAVALWFDEEPPEAAPAAIALAAAARHLGTDGQRVFKRICQQAPSALQRVVEDQGLAEKLAVHAPDLLALAARSFYLGSATNPGVHFREGVRDTGHFRYKPSNIRQRPVLQPLPWIPADAPDPADLGPFAVLFEHAPDLGLALVGQMADAATDAVSRIEAKRGRRVFSLVWPLRQGECVFAGTARSWEWAWAGSIGPLPVLSALCSLRRWAHDQAEDGADLGELVERVLGCGRAIALAAIAVGVLALNARRVHDELDPVLGQVDLWELPDSDAVQLEYALPLIVLRASADRQEGYRRLARALEAHGASTAAGAVAVAAAALRLDSTNWKVVDWENGQGQALVNEALVRKWREWRENSAGFEELVEQFALLNDAASALDGTCNADPLTLFERFERWAELEGARGDSPPDVDAVAPAVAAVVLRGAGKRPGEVEAKPLRWATQELLAAAAVTPPAVTAGMDVVTESVDPRATDRPAAAGLPVLLAYPGLLQEAGTTVESVRSAVLQLAGSAYIEVRSTLCETFIDLWDTVACTGAHDALHTVGLEVLTEMVATAGLTPQEDIEVGRQPFRLPEPVERVLTEGTPCVDLRLVADAVIGVHAAGGSVCDHGPAAGRLAAALSSHDQLTWTLQTPAMAGHAGAWRRAHDAVTAEQALSGEHGRLETYLTAFDTSPASLADVLRALAAQATDAERVRELVTLWPDLLERFGTRHDRQLCKALLPQPAKDAPWLRAQVRSILRPWAGKHANRPVLADHLIQVFEAHAPAREKETSLVLDVLGDRPQAVYYSSSRAVSFLAHVLTGEAHRISPVGDRARRLLDALAAQGHAEALRAQHRLEESAGLT